MPRRKIGADLKEALCKLYEAGDISVETIEKHAIMSRATFFRNLKMYKSGASLEQRYSTGRKTNADKLKEQEKLEFDSLQPAHLSHLELVLLLDDDETHLRDSAHRNKRKSKVTAGSSKRRETEKGITSASHASASGVADDDDPESDTDDDIEDTASMAQRQAVDKLTQGTRSFLTAGAIAASSDGGATSSIPPVTSDNSPNLDSLLLPNDSQYSHSNRGALYVVRRKDGSGSKSGSGDVIAAIALRSLIWTPQIYQALGSSYASRSIDKICNLTHLRVDPKWQRKGIGRWLVTVAELKACKLGFSHLYTQSDASRAELLSFWQRTGFDEFARLSNVARLEKVICVPTTPRKGPSVKHTARSSSTAAQAEHTSSLSASCNTEVADSSANSSKATNDPSPAEAESSATLTTNLLAAELDPAIPLDPSISAQPPTSLMAPTAAGSTNAP